MAKKRKYIGKIRNYYGGLEVKKSGDVLLWGIENWNGETKWEEIPEYLYKALIKYEKERKAKEKENNER